MDTEAQMVFLTLAKNLHFAKTAQECFMTPSTLSRTIQRMEDEIGHPLFERDNRSVRLTSVGETFKEYSEKSCAEWELFLHNVSKQFQNLTGTLRIYCSVTASYTILDRVLSLFKKKYPQVSIKLTTGHVETPLKLLQKGTVDISIAIKPERPLKNLVMRSITVSPLRFIAPKKPLFDADLITSKKIQWDQVPFIIHKQGEARKRLVGWLRQKRIKPTIYSEVAGNESAFALCSMGFGIGLFSDLFLQNNRQKNKVRTLAVKPEIQPYTIVMCTSKGGSRTPLVQAFWKETDITW